MVTVTRFCCRQAHIPDKGPLSHGRSEFPWLWRGESRDPGDGCHFARFAFPQLALASQYVHGASTFLGLSVTRILVPAVVVYLAMKTSC